MIITISTEHDPKAHESIEASNLSNLLRRLLVSNKEDGVSIEISNVEYKSTDFGDTLIDPVVITLQGDISVQKELMI